MSLQQATSRDDFPIAIICALPLEADMVKRILDIKYKDIGKDFGKVRGDRNTYTTGVIGIHNVVLIHMSDMGKINAAVAATEARISFRHIQIAFVVGICGVLPRHPETNEDIILGDCIISRTIVQYDFGRRYSDAFTRKPALPGMHNPFLPSLIAMLQTNDDRQLLTETLMNHLQAMDEASTLEDLYPGPHRDKLYQSGYRHAHPANFGRCLRCIPGTDTCQADCETMGCLTDRLVPRDRLLTTTSMLGSPRIHIGNMGSGDSVLKSSSERDRIAHEYSLIAFEMEGAGVWNSFPTVVIKSASDYADSHKNKGWQHFAAAVAAAGLKAFLQKWTSTEKAMSQAESDRWSVMSLDSDDTASIISNTPSTNFEMDATLMLHRRYQEAYPSLYRRMASNHQRSSNGSEDHQSTKTLTTIDLDSMLHSAQRPVDNGRDVSLVTDSSINGQMPKASLTTPSLDLLRLSVDVGPDFSLSMEAIGAMSIAPIFISETKHEVLPSINLQIPSALNGRALTRQASLSALGDQSSEHPLQGSEVPTELDNELVDIMSDDATLITEVIEGLIKHVKIPPRGFKLSEAEVLSPAYIMTLVVSEMWNCGFIVESERLLANFLVTVQAEVFASEDILHVGAFWLTNVHQILSFVFLAEDWYEEQKGEVPEFDRLLALVREDLESLEFNIYFTMMKALKSKLHAMIIPAMIESQEIPGFRQTASQIASNNAVNQYGEPSPFKVGSITMLLDDVVVEMKACYLEDSIITQAVTELLHLLGATAFNDMLMREDFLSWKRALQIHYNTVQIEEWCKLHEKPEATLQLEHLLQATKLLQIKKANLKDLEVIEDICWMLSPNQIHQFLSNYVSAEYETSISNEVMDAVAAKVTVNEVMALPFNDLNNSGPYQIPEPRIITALDTYTPEWLQAPQIKRLAEIVSIQARAEDEKSKSDSSTLPGKQQPG